MVDKWVKGLRGYQFDENNDSASTLPLFLSNWSPRWASTLRLNVL